MSAINPEPTEFVEENNRVKLSLHYPPEAFAMNLRAYLSTVLPALKCRMDVQLTDGKAMILRYVTSYVSKWHDGYSNQGLYSMHVTPYQAAYRHLREMQPCEPEMWLHMTSQKIAWSASRTKRYVAPTSAKANNNMEYRKYRNRPDTMEEFSFLEWLRNVNESAAKPKPYKGGNTLVGVKFASPFKDEYFFQDTLLNHPHRNESVLHHAHENDLPTTIKFFATATTLRPEIWRDPSAVQKKFEEEGHKQSFVQIIVSHVSSLHDVFNLWQRQVLSSESLMSSEEEAQLSFPIQGEQLPILQHVKAALKGRREFYANVNFHIQEEPEEEELVFNDDEEPSPEEYLPQVDWRKFILVKGDPGTGKTQVLLACIQHCLEKHQKVLVATPTGYLASTYKAYFQDRITAETIHSTFNYPVQSDE